MQPTVGRTVLYTSLGDSEGKYPSEQQAAIITKVVAVEKPDAALTEERFKVSLSIFYPTGLFWMAEVPYSPQFKRGCWTWPPRVG